MKKNIIPGSILAICLLSLIIGVAQVITTPGQEAPQSKMIKESQKILVLNIEGVIESDLGGDSSFNFRGSSAQKALKSLQDAAYSDNLKAVLIRVNSPGGTVGASQEIYRAIMTLRSQGKYVVASIADIGTSGAYYIASACDYIYSNPGSMVGSVGVIMSNINMERLFDKLGLKSQIIKGGKYKDIFSSFRNPTQEEKVMLQQMADDIHKQFIDDVMANRKDKIKNINKVKEAQIYTGRQALAIGMIDECGGKAEALAHISKKIGIKDASHAIIEKKYNMIEKLLSEIELNSKISINPMDYISGKTAGTTYVEDISNY